MSDKELKSRMDSAYNTSGNKTQFKNRRRNLSRILSRDVQMTSNHMKKNAQQH